MPSVPWFQITTWLQQFLRFLFKNDDGSIIFHNCKKLPVFYHLSYFPDIILQCSIVLFWMNLMKLFHISQKLLKSVPHPLFNLLYVICWMSSLVLASFWNDMVISKSFSESLIKSLSQISLITKAIHRLGNVRKQR